MAFPPIYNTRETADYMRESFVWRWRRASRPPRPLLEDFHALWPCFSLPEAEAAAVDSEIPEMVQETFYAMLLNEAVELGVVHSFSAEGLEVVKFRGLDELGTEGSAAPTAGAPSCPFKVLFILVYYAIVFSSSGDVPEGSAGPQMEGRHPQFPSLLAIINGRVVAGVRRMAKTKSTLHIRSPDELLAKGTQEGASTGSSSPEGLSALGKSMLKKKGWAPKGLVAQIVAEGPEFPGAPTRSDLQDGPGNHFRNPKVVPTLKRLALEKLYLLRAGYTFVIPEKNATVNELLAKCIAVYCVTLDYDLRFPLYLMIEEILNKYELASIQVVPTSRHNVCSFIATCELHGLTCSAWAFSLVHTVQRAPKETRDLRWYCFNHRSGFMAAIEKKSKVKHWKVLVIAMLITFMFGRGLTSLLFYTEQARARLTVFKTEDAIPKQVAADAKRWHPLVSRGKKPTISLPVSKQQRNEGPLDETVASAPSQDLVTPGASDPPKVTEEEVALVKAFALGVRAAAECRRLEGLVSRHQWHWEKLKADLNARAADKKSLQRQLEEALMKAEADAAAGPKRVAQAKEQGYQQGHADTLGGYDPEEVKFIPPGKGEGVGDEATNSLDTEAGASEEEGHEDSRKLDV
ncbi:hypothetical protein Cgig2_032955 [Carnegiea gigantea]|uniref:Uncharacterized protein n=1 Tax=Carnegiea gigantea TaxID=171969 RepID=A0A9Q1GXQ4_9CARY|nr:hypothetical protein Cgig2_032955 [Carnegiea gigantea]